MKKIVQNAKGFTLIELMIVVAIIGILAAIAIPNFLRYQLKSKTAEARTNIGAIKTSQEAFRAEWDGYAICGQHPAGVPTDVKADWGVGNVGFNAIGYAPSGSVYYRYQVNAAAGTGGVGTAFASPFAGVNGLTGHSGGYAIGAYGNLDKKGGQGQYVFASDVAVPVNGLSAVANSVIEDKNPGEF